ncbi:ribosome maturation factor RimM [Roseateles sp. BYS180W]|uniref:Ribosome maturation factor RimM n=1 Tax=Roseateles rivi TaxID=3299028 RepID=A0ABW7FZK9_9BURK
MTVPTDLNRAAPQAAAWPEDAIEVGRVLDAWGIKGWVKVLSHSTDAEALFAARRWYLKPSERALPGKPAAVPPVLNILSIRDHGDGIVAHIDGVVDRNGAEALKGARIFVSRAEFPQPVSDDEFYWVDLIGLVVVNRAGEPLGEVLDLIDTGPHCVLRICPPGLVAPIKPEQERLIPFVSQFVLDVSLPDKRITVDWGLDY